MIVQDGPGEPDEAYCRLFVPRLGLHIAAGTEDSVNLIPIAERHLCIGRGFFGERLRRFAQGMQKLETCVA